METFDQSLKHLLEHEPADFVRFALKGATVELIKAVAVTLPSRGRAIDGGHRVRVGGVEKIAHTEFQRRHQSQSELAVDVAEAQVRMYRREGVEVVSLVWDLYGRRDEPVRSERVLRFAANSQSAYVRVNLRGMGWRELLAEGPPALWPLVALTGDGATDEAVHAARDAIVARPDLSAAQKADHVAVLWFVAEAEDVAVTAMKAYIREEDLMQSVLYQEIFAKGELKGELKGKLEGELKARTAALLELLELRGIPVSDAVRAEILACRDLPTLEHWFRRAAKLKTATAVIRSRPEPRPAEPSDH